MKEQSASNHLFTNKDLRLLLIPLQIEQVLNSFMGTMDTIMVSNVGSAAISAVSLVDSINVLIIQVFSALATGGTIVCAQYIGKQRKEKANQSAGQLMLVVLGISVFVMLVCLIGNEVLLRLIFGKVENNVMESAKIYFFYTALSFPFIALFNAGGAVYRAQGNSKLPMKISVISNFINIFGNAFFIWGLKIGVAGVAIATLVSRMFCAIVILKKLYEPGQMITVREYKKIRPEFALIGMILTIGIPSGIENGMFQFGKLAIQSTVSTMGTTAMAAQAMTNILENLNGVGCQGIGIGLMTIVGQCMGAGRKDEAGYYIRKFCALAEIVMIANCLLVFALTKPITFLGGMEAESAALCFQMVTAITICKPLFWIFSFVPAYGMRAAGDVKFSMIVSTCTMWLCRVSLCVFLVKQFHMGPMAVWIGMFADWGIRSVIFGLRLKSGKWAQHSVV